MNPALALQQIRRLPTTAREAGVLVRAGLAPITRPHEVANAMVTIRNRGMVAGAVRIAARRDPDLVGLVDELGELTFRELDERSNALARAWQQRGLGHTSVIAVLCRDHRGLLDSMFAAGKLGREAAADEHRFRQAAVRRGGRARGRRHAGLRLRVR